MTNRVLVEVFLPASNSRHDVYLPSNARMHEILPLLANLLGEVSNGYFIPTGDTAVCMRETGVVLDLNRTPKELGLKNGVKLMVI